MSCIHIYRAIQKGSSMFEIYVPLRYNTMLGNSSRLVLLNTVTNHSRQSIRYQGCVHWNDLPKNLREIENLNCFKVNLKKIFVVMILLQKFLCVLYQRNLFNGIIYLYFYI